MSEKSREWGITAYTDRFKLIHIDSSEREDLLEGHIDDDDAQLIAVAPELLSVTDSFELKGPDDDGLFWLVLKAGDYGKSFMFNLGHKDEWFASGIIDFEQRRKAVLGKAKGEHG